MPRDLPTPAHLRPLLEEIIEISAEYIKMIDAVSDDADTDDAAAATA